MSRRKIKKRKGFLIAAIVLLIIGIPTTATLPVLLTVAKNASINDYVNPKEYPVNNAIRKHDNNKLKKLLAKGANPNELFQGSPAIFTACCNFDDGVNYEAAKILINYKANLNAKDDNQDSLMKEIMIGNQRYDDQSDIYKIVKLLISHGYNINEKDSNGISLLMYATADSTYDSGYTLPYKLTKLLVRSGATINEKDKMGRTVLMWACASDISTTDINENTPKTHNIELKDQFAPFDYNIINYFIKLGVDVNSKDKQGFTALDYFNQAEESSKKWYQYRKVGQTKDYIDNCKKIELILQGK